MFLRSAFRHLPLLTRYHIGLSTAVVRHLFWETCDGFSLNFAVLMGDVGQAFLADCRKAGKEVCVWTVNDEREMRIAMGWGVKAVLTDKAGTYVGLRKEVSHLEDIGRMLSTRQVEADPSKLRLQGLSGYLFGWSRWRYYSVAHVRFCSFGDLS